MRISWWRWSSLAVWPFHDHKAWRVAMPRYLFLTWALFRLIAYLSSGKCESSNHPWLPWHFESFASNSGANDLGPWGKSRSIKDQPLIKAVWCSHMFSIYMYGAPFPYWSALTLESLGVVWPKMEVEALALRVKVFWCQSMLRLQCEALKEVQKWSALRCANVHNLSPNVCP